ncbi:MAG: D-alanine--D-alanine ligase [Clostridia bacterium]|nr:D-alanine--D-alanine ligase [Clostridia bacterium]
MENRVAVIYGGMGTESEISALSAKFVLSEIDRELFSPLPVFIAKNGLWFIKAPDEKTEGLACYPARTKCGCGLMTAEGFIPLFAAFPVLHGDFGEDGIIQGALTCAGIPFVGCKTCSGALSADKALTKQIAEAASVPTAPWVLGNEEPTDGYIEKIKLKAELAFGYPMFIKPSVGGSSIGISRIERSEDFSEAYLKAAKYGNRVIAEEAISVRLELECAVLIDGKQIFTKIGAVSTGGGFYDFDKKYFGGASATPFAPITQGVYSAVTSYAESLCSCLDIKQLSRIDFFLTDDGGIVFNEINTMPGFTAASLYPRLIERCGIAPRELITRLIKGASL